MTALTSQPVVIAAIASAALATVVLAIYLLHRHMPCTKRRLSPAGSPSTSPSESEMHLQSASVYPYPTTGMSGGTSLFGSAQISHQASNPSTGYATLVNPTAAAATAPHHQDSVKTKGKGGRGSEESMVMITYEEGLRKLGLWKPHHILYPDPPAPRTPEHAAYTPTTGSSSNTTTTTTTTSSSGSGSGTGQLVTATSPSFGGGGTPPFRRPGYVREETDGTFGHYPRMEEMSSPTSRQGGKGGSAWVPSYYQQAGTATPTGDMAEYPWHRVKG